MMQEMVTRTDKRPRENTIDVVADNTSSVTPSWAKRLCIRLLETSDLTLQPVPLPNPRYDETTVTTSVQNMYSHFDGTTFHSERIDPEPTTENLIELVDAKLYHLHGSLATSNTKIREMEDLRIQKQREHNETVCKLQATIDAMQQKMGILKNGVASLIDNSEDIAKAADAHKKRVEAVALALMA